MRKLALLFAFVLVMACAGSAFAAGSASFNSMTDLNKTGDDFLGHFSTIIPGDANTVTITVLSDDPNDVAGPEHFQKIRNALANDSVNKLDFAAGGRYDIVINIKRQKEIPAGAFDGDKFLTKVTLTVAGAANLQKIGANAFANTPNLTVITDGTSGYFTRAAGVEIGDKAFYASGLNTTIGFANVKKIGKEAFAANAYLGATDTSNQITWGTSITEIGDGAFRGTSLAAANSALDTNSVLTALVSIGKEAFMGTKLTKIDLKTGATVTTIGDRAFKDIVMDTPNSTTSADILLPDGLMNLGEEAFAGAKIGGSNVVPASGFQINLSALTNITKIPAGLFKDSGFTKVKVMDELEEIGAYAFYNTSKLAYLESKASPASGSGNPVIGFIDTELKTIGDYAFAQSALITDIPGAGGAIYNTSLTFPKTLTEIGNHAFSQAHGVTSMLFYAGDSAYNPLTPKAFNDSLPKLGINAFANMDQWTGYLFNINNTSKLLSNVVFGIPYENNANAPETVTLVSALAKAGLPVRKIESLTGLTFSVVEDIVDKVTPQLPPTINAPSGNLSGTVGVEITPYTLTATGATPITWSFDDKSKVEWLNLSSSGVLSGKPTTAGTFEFTVRATNNIDSDSVKITIVVASSATPPGGGSGSTGGSGGCAAGFAPIAALFVLGALKLRKGR